MEKEESLTRRPKSSDRMREKSSMMIVASSSSTTKAELFDSGRTPNKPNPLNFDTYMPWACKLFQVDVVIKIDKMVQRQSMFSRSIKLKKRKKSDTTFADEDATAATPTDGKDKSEVIPSTGFMGSGFYTNYKANQIIATYDIHNNLIKINLNNNKEVPRTLLIILSLIVKFYPALTTLTVNSGINMYSIYEISKLLPKSALKEIYLDGTRIRNPNYHILLETANNLTCLSLARCQIGDVVLKHITDLLIFPLPASKTLTYLNLSSNGITNKGIAYLAEALRTNRQLTSLNLTDNHIDDTGASYIFDILLQFPITKEEMVQSKFRRLKYIKEKTALVARFVAELKIAEEMKYVKKKSIVGTREVISDIKYTEKAQTLATKTLGEYKDPFQSPASFKKNGRFFCTGNTALASINLSYNNLSYVTLNKLLKVLNYQKDITQRPRGLFRVSMEGNYLPGICDEYTEIIELLGSSLDFHQPMAKKKAALK